MHYGKIKKNDISNGEGVRVTLFCSGCRRHCPGCFQPETWDFNYGSPFTLAQEDEILSLLSPSYVDGITLMGGEPFEPENRPALIKLLQRIRATYPQKNVWAYTGFTYEELDKNGDAHEMLHLIDVLVDGQFDEKKKNLALPFRGSENQRIIDVQKTLASGCVVIKDPFYSRL